MSRVRLLSLSLLAAVSLGLGGTGIARAAGHLDAYALQPQFICVSCHEPLNQVNSPEAIAEKNALAGFVNQGLSFNQVKAAMVSTYGEAVLARPPARGLNLLVYVLPPAFLLAGLLFIVLSLPRWRRRARADQLLAGDRELGLRMDPADARRLDEELSHFEV